MSIVICPECGKELTVSDPNRKFIFCRHCGAKIEIAAFVKKPPKQPPQEPIIAPPSKDLQSETSSQEPSAEQLHHQHEPEMERLRYEHELELERLRHENEMERERMKLNHTAEETEDDEPEKIVKQPSKKVNRSSEPKGIAWHLGHFWKKHPIWSIIILISVFQIMFGGSTSSSSSVASSKSSVNAVSATEHDFASSYNFSSAYTYTSDTGTTYYFLFDTDAQLVCFVSSASNDASISTLSGSDFATGFESVFHYSDGNYHRSFKYSDPSSDAVLTVSESWKSDTQTVIQFEKTDIEMAEAALNKKDSLQIATLSN